MFTTDVTDQDEDIVTLDVISTDTDEAEMRHLKATKRGKKKGGTKSKKMGKKKSLSTSSSSSSSSTD